MIIGKNRDGKKLPESQRRRRNVLPAGQKSIAGIVCMIQYHLCSLFAGTNNNMKKYKCLFHLVRVVCDHELLVRLEGLDGGELLHVVDQQTRKPTNTNNLNMCLYFLEYFSYQMSSFRSGSM